MYFTRKSQGVLFYHLKGIRNLKDDNSNLYFLKTKKAKKIINRTYSPTLISWTRAKKKYSFLKNVPDPNKIFFKQYEDIINI